MREAEFGDAIGVFAIGLERSCGIDDGMRVDVQYRLQAGPQIELERLAAIAGRKSFRFRQVSPGDPDAVTVSQQQSGQPAAEDTIASEDDDLHSINRRRNSGSGIAHIWVRPRIRYRFRAIRR